MEQRCKLKKNVLKWGIVLLVLFVIGAADIAVFKWLSELYRERENLIYAMAGGGRTDIESAAFLKEEPSVEEIERGKEKLAAYGYDEEFSSVWQSFYEKTRNQLIGYSILAVLFVLALLFAVRHIYVSAYKKQLQAITLAVIRMQSKEQQPEEHTILFTEDLPGASEYEEILKDRMKSLQEQITLQNERMEEEKEETKRLVTDISHQIKTPIAALKNSLELLQEDITEEERQEFLKRALKQLEGLSGLAGSMVSISRMEKGLIMIQREMADIVKTIRESVNRVWEKAEQKDIAIMLEDGDEIKEVMVCHDVKWTVEALSNILDNAIKYSPEHSNIRIRLIFLTMYLKIEIEDEGIGIAKEEYHQIFQRFYRSPSVKDQEGSGIGLYLTREILERQEGSVVVRSRRGSNSGSIFAVQFPWNRS